MDSMTSRASSRCAACRTSWDFGLLSTVRRVLAPDGPVMAHQGTDRSGRSQTEPSSSTLRRRSVEFRAWTFACRSTRNSTRWRPFSCRSADSRTSCCRCDSRESSRGADSEIFLDNSLGKCNICHLNAGANAVIPPDVNPSNANFNTGVENLPDIPQKLTGERVPVDDGFGMPGDGDLQHATAGRGG